MPTYEYLCKDCNKRFDYFQSITAPALKSCPAELCKKKGTVERQISSGGGFLFKGEGFYATDYRSSRYTEAKKKAEKPEKACGENGCKSGQCSE